MRPIDYLHKDALPKELKSEKVKQEFKDYPTVTTEHVEAILSNTMIQCIPMPEIGPNMLAIYYVLPNGYNGVEYSACVHPGSFDIDVATNIVLDKIAARVYELEGYLLKQRLYEERGKGKG